MKVKMHSGCIGQELVAIRRMDPPALRCFCKKMIDYSEANELVKSGAAIWVVIKRTYGKAEVECTLCTGMNDIEKKTCANCHGTGKTMEAKIWEEFNNDIVLTSTTPIDENNKKYRLNTRGKTPRVATIEPKHIYRSVVEKLKYAAERIEDYGNMIQMALTDFGAELRRRKYHFKDSGQIIVNGHPEPVDDPRTRQGRSFDWGTPAVSGIGLSGEPVQDDDLLFDRPTNQYTPKTAGGTGSLDERYKDLLAYSRRKIQEGDYSVCQDGSITAAGISWPHADVADDIVLRPIEVWDFLEGK